MSGLGIIGMLYYGDIEIDKIFYTELANGEKFYIQLKNQFNCYDAVFYIYNTSYVFGWSKQALNCEWIEK